uniref:Transmembrane protein n=1 Tax=Aureoumbra lagunensis TaxID=44058 RepID=A0A7S3NLZ7_9STRA|mmetsp:Transcript_14596/g.18033  ORF Transcript_14596/g.18033 Transcript_14596/m.18033 type:complete len:116 (+) Transcript_14596:151-498(+)
MTTTSRKNRKNLSTSLIFDFGSREATKITSRKSMKFKLTGKCLFYTLIVLSLYSIWVWYWIAGIEIYPIPAYSRRVQHRNEILEPQRKAWALAREKVAKSRKSYDDMEQEIAQEE